MDCIENPFKQRTVQEEDPMVHTMQKWELGLTKSGILGLIHIPHFGRLTQANACAKKLLACLHGGYMWLDQLVQVTIELISQIMMFPKEGLNPSQ